MPIYEYQCQACKAPYEARQSISDPPLTKCPACGQEALERIVSHSSFALKGGGWYADGYGEKKSGGSGSGVKPTKSDGAAKTDKAEKVDAPKPEPKADSGDKKP